MADDYYFMKQEIKNITRNIDTRSTSNNNNSRSTIAVRSSRAQDRYGNQNNGYGSQQNNNGVDVPCCYECRECSPAQEFVPRPQSPISKYCTPRKSVMSTCYVRCPTPPPIIQRIVERCPTPEPDVIQRIIVKPQPKRFIERVIEKPRVPPPVVVEKVVCEDAPEPIYKTKVVEVDHAPRPPPPPQKTCDDECELCCDCCAPNTPGGVQQASASSSNSSSPQANQNAGNYQSSFRRTGSDSMKI